MIFLFFIFQEKKLKSLEKQCAVEIKIDKTTGNQKIRLVTEDGDLSKATAGIFEILLGMVTKERDSKVLELFAKQVNDHCKTCKWYL